MTESWEKEFSKDTSWIPTLCNFVTPLGIALSFSIILGDTFSSLAKSIGLTGLLATRQCATILVTYFLLYPLSSLTSLKALAPFSLMGIMGVLLTTLFMLFRLVTCAYSPTGPFLNTLPFILRPSFHQTGMDLLSPSTLLLPSIVATAFLVHFSSPQFYKNLKNNTLKRFGTLTAVGFSFTTLVNLAVMSIGFLTFGGSCDAVIINNYSSKDLGAILCRLCIGISLIGSYPLMIHASRDNCLDLWTRFRRTKSKPQTSPKKLTQILMTVITSLALILPSAGFVVSLNGAIMGSAIIYVFPSLLFIKSTSRKIKEGTLKLTKFVRLERLFNKGLIGLGLVLGILGGTVTVLDTFLPHLLGV